jgi:hypothetical protein
MIMKDGAASVKRRSVFVKAARFALNGSKTGELMGGKTRKTHETLWE